MKQNGHNYAGAADDDKNSQQSVSDDLATANDIILARLRKLLRERRGSIFECPDGNCVVIQLHDP